MNAIALGGAKRVHILGHTMTDRQTDRQTQAPIQFTSGGLWLTSGGFCPNKPCIHYWVFNHMTQSQYPLLGVQPHDAIPVSGSCTFQTTSSYSTNCHMQDLTCAFRPISTVTRRTCPTGSTHTWSCHITAFHTFKTTCIATSINVFCTVSALIGYIRCVNIS